MKKELFMEKSPRRGLKNKASRILINILVTLVLGLLYFYVSLPAINLHDSNFYGFFFVLCIIYVVCALITSGFHMDASGGIKEYFRFIKSQCLPIGILMLLLIVIAILGTVISMPIFRAASYRDLLTVENGDFAAEVEEISFDQIPMLDAVSYTHLDVYKRQPPPGARTPAQSILTPPVTSRSSIRIFRCCVSKMCKFFPEWRRFRTPS